MQQYIDFGKELAAASSEVILHYYQNHVTVENKTDGSPVTPADREAEQLRFLAACHARRRNGDGQAL